MTGRERVLRTLRHEEVDALPNMPITMMKAAAEIGVPYRTYALDAEAHVRGQMAISRKYRIDHVSCISDPAVEAADLGATVIYREDAPPSIDESDPLLADSGRLLALPFPDPWAGERMRTRLQVISRLKEESAGEKAVEGWIEGPIAEACDLRGLSRIMTDFYDAPGFVRDLIDFAVRVGVDFARAQVEAGADYIGMGDAAASLIGPDLYKEFVLEAEKRCIEEIHRLGVPVRLHICGNITPLLGAVVKCRPDMVDLDSMVAVRAARAAFGSRVCLAGNINPVAEVRNGSPGRIFELLGACFRDAGASAFAVAAGCEIPRDTPVENLRAMGDFARTHSPAPLSP